MPSFKVLVKGRGNWKLYQVCQSKEEAQKVMDKLNERNLSRLYKRAKAKAKARGWDNPKISYKQYAQAYSKTCIQW